MTKECPSDPNSFLIETSLSIDQLQQQLLEKDKLIEDLRLRVNTIFT